MVSHKKGQGINNPLPAEDGGSGFNPEADGPLTIAYKGATLDVEYKAAR